MSRERTTAQKRNAYRIRERVSQAVFRQLIVSQGDEILKGTVVGRFERPLLSCLSGIATKAIMNEPGIDVVLKKKR